MAGQQVMIRWHSPSRHGKGQELGPFTTDTTGRFSTVVRVDEAGAHQFGAGNRGSGPTVGARAPAAADVQVRVTSVNRPISRSSRRP
jgi:hypothetical protein